MWKVFKNVINSRFTNLVFRLILGGIFIYATLDKIAHKMRKGFQRIINNRYTILVFRLVLGGIFIYASLDKIAHPEQFAKIVYNYKILPHSLINIFAIILPWVELICGVFLLVGIFMESSSAILSLLLVVFIIALSVNFLRGLDINCGCFSTNPKGKEEGAVLLIRDLVLLAIGLQIFFNKVRRLSHD